MKNLFICIAVCFLSLNHSAFAQCRTIAPDAVEWIENNKEKIAKMTRAEWLKLGEGYKWIVFTKLSPEQKHDFFELKIEQVKNDFVWNEAEKKHLEKLQLFFANHPDLYDETKRTENNSEIDNFLKEWTSYAVTNLKWKPKLMQGMIGSCNDLLDKEGNLKVTAKVKTKPIDTGGSKTD